MKLATPLLIVLAAVLQPGGFSDEQLEQWVFQQDRNAAGARKRMETMVSMHVEEIDRTCGLSEGQKQKLRLAARGDIKRFFDRYDKVREKFKGVKQDDDRFNEIWQDINPLQTSLQSGLFREDSLLLKTVPHALTPEQALKYESAAAERRAFRHQASIASAIGVLEQSMPLRETQRRELTELLLRETKPSPKTGQYEYYLVMYRLSKLPETRVKPLFDDFQWQVIKGQMDQYRGMQQFLRQQGMLAEEEPDDGPRPALRRAVKRAKP